MSKLMRVITGACYKTKTSAVFINQVRTNVGVMYGDPSTTTGGKALAFYSTQRIAFRRTKIKAGEPITEEAGLKIACRVIKNRLARKNPFTTCEYYAEYGIGINTICELPGMLEREGILRRAGAYYYWEDENGQPLTVGGQECKFKSKAFLVECLTNNTELREKLSEALNERIMGGTVQQTSLSDEEIGKIKQLETTLELEETFEEPELEEAV